MEEISLMPCIQAIFMLAEKRPISCEMFGRVILQHIKDLSIAATISLEMEVGISSQII